MNLIETYIIKWKSFGFDAHTLEEISAYCFKHSIRTAEGMDGVIERYFKMGITSLSAINEYLTTLQSLDEKIKDVLEKSGAKRNVTDWDRNYFRTWTQSWNMPFDVILYAAEKAMGKGGISYLNALLSHYNSKNAHTLDEVKKISFEQKNTSVITRKSADEINALGVFGHRADFHKVPDEYNRGKEAEGDEGHQQLGNTFASVTGEEVVDAEGSKENGQQNVGDSGFGHISVWVGLLFFIGKIPLRG